MKNNLFARDRTELGLGNEWHPVKNYPGYWINAYAEVLSAHCTALKMIKWQVNRRGYSFTSIRNKDGRKMFYQHRLVAMQFIPNPLNLPCINHKDNFPWNNNIDNLEWCTYAYNSAYSAQQGRRGRALTLSDAKTIKRLLPILTRLELAHLFGVSGMSISSIKNNKLWKTA